MLTSSQTLNINMGLGEKKIAESSFQKKVSSGYNNSAL